MFNVTSPIEIHHPRAVLVGEFRLPDDYALHGRLIGQPTQQPQHALRDLSRLSDDFDTKVSEDGNRANTL